MRTNEDIDILNGKTITKVFKRKDYQDLVFKMSDGTWFQMYHQQDCCEPVWLEDVSGVELEDLEGATILSLNKRTNDEETPPENADFEAGYDRCLWTFYRLNTNKGTTVFRWFGYSHYYSVDVTVEKIRDEYTFNELKEEGIE